MSHEDGLDTTQSDEKDSKEINKQTESPKQIKDDQTVGKIDKAKDTIKRSTKEYIIDQFIASIKLFSLQNFKQGFKRFSLPSIATIVVLLIVFAILNSIDLSFTGLPLKPNPLRILYSIFVAIILSAFFFFIGTVIGPQIGNFLVTNKYAKLVYTKGDVHYFEKQTEKERQVGPGNIISKLITLLLTWTSVATALISLLLAIFGQSDFIQFLNETSIFIVILRNFIILILSPLILAFMIPLGWFLIDIKLKAFKNGIKTNWLVGKKVDSTLRNIITIGSVITAAGASAGDLVQKVVAIVQIFVYNFVMAGLAGLLTVILYYILLSGGFYTIFTSQIAVPFGHTHVDLDEQNPETEED